MCTEEAISYLDMGKEVKILSAIEANPYAKEGRRFPRLLGSFKPPFGEDLCSWFVMSAIEPGLTLKAFMEPYTVHNVELPVEFVAHVFPELCNMLIILHERARVAHKDIHNYNILINLTAPRQHNKMPKLALIDFGMGTDGSQVELSISTDVRGSALKSFDSHILSPSPPPASLGLITSKID
ncbi:hypothetical protein K491DRAFT_721838 [Lophiostoma macrostomum CBS 122681]|uniref:Protein kinase domain-containing protein n=1 Tax=Lophiostoma macrostomum CBS 122681 TaxID=1314788 RepID=A0A6A6SNJ0_9PLEO|nr:hypothetical protein K491DRAFT_721838 [Lophiostoma macrostomum CBS 122681]